MTTEVSTALTMEEAWRQFSKNALPATAPLDMRMMAKEVFFSGLICMFGMLVNNSMRFAETGELVEMNVSYLHRLQSEIRDHLSMRGGDSVVRVHH